jgi:hypothetical protein
MGCGPAKIGEFIELYAGPLRRPSDPFIKDFLVESVPGPGDRSLQSGALKPVWLTSTVCWESGV